MTQRSRSSATWFAGLLCLGLAVASPRLSAQVNYCPGPPHSCVVFDTCNQITWCEDQAGSCGMLAWNYEYFKYVIIKQCEWYDPEMGMLDTVFCSACGAPQSNGCCVYQESEMSCPDQSTCN